jgi:hypothetical protein
MPKTQLSPTIRTKPLLSKSSSSKSSSSKSAASKSAASKSSASKSSASKSSASKSSSSKLASSKLAAAFTAAVALKDTNRFHNIPKDLQTEIMRMARERKKNSRGKYELYKKIYYDRQKFMDWLDEIKRDGVDNKNRVRNPLRKGSMIYTDKNGLYSKLWHLCIQIFQGDYDIRGVPVPVKRYYKKAQLKFFNKPPQ